MLFRPALNLVRRKPSDSTKSNMTGVPFTISAESRDHRLLTCSASPSFTSFPFTSPVSVINLDKAKERLDVIGLFHDHLEFVFRPYSCIGGNSEVSAHRQSSHTFF
ncbi:hypothetical protein SAMN05660330_04184 [Desulforhopalus singaporensis]|uniref:Uncharacterized protein n=1 Tax=Desulforhopalus singaporensis TaxID=91360 RepID=A0A1H0VQ74_9BACT|nr:hypothetical protein SAMN05660330_04184 [Desulforhopalus singaporensis]